MATALPPKTVSSIYNPSYFTTESADSIGITKVDRIAGTATNLTLAGTITGVDVADVNGLQDALDNIDISDVQSNVPFPIVSDGVKAFNSDMVAYYDFSDSSNLGRDCSGYNNHATNKGVSYLADGTRNHCASFTPILSSSTNSQYSNHRVLDIPADKVANFRTAEFSVSFWYWCPLATGNNAIFTMANLSGNTQSHFVMIHGSGNTRIICQLNSVTNFDIPVATTESAWHHVAFSMGTGGNALYVDGVLATTYTVGSSSTYLNFSGVGANQIWTTDAVCIGATRGTELFAYPIEPQYKFPFSGRISDFSYFNRALSATEMLALYADDYGYMCILLAGQSNMIGLGNTFQASDYDYSAFGGKVYQFETYNNIRHTSGTISAGNPYTPVAPYDVVAGTISQLVSIGSTKNLWHPMDLGTGYGLGPNQTVGLWKTFVDDYMQYATIPYRKKVLLLPCAIGGTDFITHWSPGQICYETTKSVCNYVLAPGANTNRFNVLAGMLWNQGENSVSNLDTNHKANFIAMIAGFQTDITGFTSTLPIVVGQISGNFYDSYVATVPTPDVSMKYLVNNAYTELASEYANISLVTTLGETQFQADLKHIDSASLRILGQKYYNAYCEASGMANRKNVDSNAIVVNSKNGVRDLVVTPATTFSNNVTVTGDVTSTNITTMTADILDARNRLSVLEPVACDVISSAVTMSKTYTLAYLPSTIVSALSGSSVLTISLPAVSAGNDGRTWTVYLRTIGVGSSVVINVTGGANIDISLGTSTLTTTASYTLQSGPANFSRKTFYVMNGQWFL